MRAGVLEDAGDRLGFAHALVRQVVYEEIPASLRRQLHRETAAALIANGVAPERVAMHIALREAETLANQVLQRCPGPSVAGRLRAGIVYALCWQGRPGQALAESLPAEPDLAPDQRVLVEAEGLVAQILTGDVAAAGPRIAGVLHATQRSGHTLARCHALCAATRERMLSGHLLKPSPSARRPSSLPRPIRRSHPPSHGSSLGSP